jgi:hypothetical protein
MGFLKELVEDAESVTQFREWRARRVATVLALILPLGYLAGASGHLGDSVKDLLCTKGLSPFQGVDIELNVQEEGKYEFEGGGHDADQLRVLVAGKVVPCAGATRVVVDLFRTDAVDPLKPDGHRRMRSKDWTQTVQTEPDCRWSAPNPFYLSELGSYEVEARVHKFGHDIGRTTQQLKRIRPTGVEQSNLFVGAPPKQQPGLRKGVVTVVYLAPPNFNKRVFERALLELNKRMESFETQIAEFTGPSCVGKDETHSPDCFEKLKKFHVDSGVVVGIVPNTLVGASGTRNLFSSIEDGRRLAVFSSDQGAFFDGRSSPSIYKYLLTMIVSVGATIGRDRDMPLFYHRDTRGCLFDYDEEKIRGQISVELGYLCEEHRTRFKEAGIAPEALRDLTERLPLDWLK